MNKQLSSEVWVTAVEHHLLERIKTQREMGRKLGPQAEMSMQADFLAGAMMAIRAFTNTPSTSSDWIIPGWIVLTLAGRRLSQEKNDRQEEHP